MERQENPRLRTESDIPWSTSLATTGLFAYHLESWAWILDVQLMVGWGKADLNCENALNILNRFEGKNMSQIVTVGVPIKISSNASNQLRFSHVSPASCEPRYDVGRGSVVRPESSVYRDRILAISQHVPSPFKRLRHLRPSFHRCGPVVLDCKHQPSFSIPVDNAAIGTAVAKRNLHEHTQSTKYTLVFQQLVCFLAVEDLIYRMWNPKCTK